MGSRWHRSVVVLACAGLLASGCTTAGGHGGSAGGDADVLVERALAARAASDSEQFAAFLSAAAEACPDPSSARRLAEVAVIADRWSSALQDGRPKVQAVTEEQLAAIEWNTLVAACVKP